MQERNATSTSENDVDDVPAIDGVVSNGPIENPSSSTATSSGSFETNSSSSSSSSSSNSSSASSSSSNRSSVGSGDSGAVDCDDGGGRGEGGGGGLVGGELILDDLEDMISSGEMMVDGNEGDSLIDVVDRDDGSKSLATHNFYKDRGTDMGDI